MGVLGTVPCDLIWISPKSLICRRHSRFVGIVADCSLLPSAEVKTADNGDQQNYDSQTDSEAAQLQSISERWLMAKIDLHLLPCLCILYLLAFLDR